MMKWIGCFWAAAIVSAAQPLAPNPPGALPGRAGPGESGHRPKPLAAAGITNLYRLSDRIYSGSAPEGEEGFRSLRALGVRTIITVDGSKPQVDLAHQNGLRYVHLPHGYNGIETNLQLQLIAAARRLPGPIYVHCHHGQHRGPAAAAVICLGSEGWSRSEALDWLGMAGTSTNYPGLFQTIETFQPPPDAAWQQVPLTFPEVAAAGGLVDAMVAIDQQWDRLRAVRHAGYVRPENHPDLLPANEAGLLREDFREAQRLTGANDRGSDFQARLRTAEEQAQSLEESLRSLAAADAVTQSAHLDSLFEAVGRSCAACHRAYRDKPLSSLPGAGGAGFPRPVHGRD